jgi:hypothetical protein
MNTTEIKKPQNNRVLVATFLKEQNRKESFSSISCFLKHYPGRNKHTIHSYIGRMKVPYVDEEIIIERIKHNKS